MAKQRLAGLRVLIVEDEALLRRRFAASLEGLGAEAMGTGSREEAERMLADAEFDVVLLDVNLPDGRGTELLAKRVIPSATTVLVMTASGGIAGAVEAMRLGAADYLVKPFDLDELPLRIDRARKAQQARRANEFRQDDQAGGSTEAALIFGPGLERVKGQLEKIVEADRRREGPLSPVLIEGETGTGKTAFARWLHRNGPRSGGSMIEVNCAALPAPLAESELFGHERGAFTDAATTRIGLMEAAEGGTLFLDELPSLALALQAKVLTAIEDHVIRRVGSNRARPVDGRIIAATNVDLNHLVRDGRFRGDLVQRLDLFHLRIPPLRERRDDIVPLAGHLVAKIGRQYGLNPGTIPEKGRQRLLAHSWPGNVRELAHEIERTLVFNEDGANLEFAALAARGHSDAAGNGWLNPHFQFPESGFSLATATDELVAHALRQSSGNVSAAARLLGVSRDVVRYRLESNKPGAPNGE